MGSNPHANGGQLKKTLRLPDFRTYACTFEKPGQIEAENTRPLGQFLRDVMRLNRTRSASLVRMKTRRTNLMRFTRRVRSSGSRNIFLKTAMEASCHLTVVSSRCSASTRWKECWKDTKGISIWEQASNDAGQEPDVAKTASEKHLESNSRNVLTSAPSAPHSTTRSRFENNAEGVR